MISKKNEPNDCESGIEKEERRKSCSFCKAEGLTLFAPTLLNLGVAVILCKNKNKKIKKNSIFYFGCVFIFYFLFYFLFLFVFIIFYYFFLLLFIFLFAHLFAHLFIYLFIFVFLFHI